jgi:lipopolysaccharide transport system ATP-binding protein
MSSELLVRLQGVCKSYPIFDKPYQRLLHLLWPTRKRGGQFHALTGVDLAIRRGESIGIIGRNGAGKSTLLQVLTGILDASAGTVEVYGRVAALLELGAGFNPEFTGRENIRLNAGLLGLSPAEIDGRMDEILAFAEIGEHVDQLVKTYSSGMFTRLAFAVAVHTDPDVLIVDEALSVGDVYFQRKCFRRIGELRERGCTLLFVTHSIDSVIQLCDRGLVLEKGRVAFDGAAREAVKAYLRLVFGENAVDDDAEEALPIRQVDARDAQADRELDAEPRDLFHQRPGYNRDEIRLGDGRAITCDFQVRSASGIGPVVQARETFTVSVKYYFPIPLDRLIFGVRLCQVTGQVVYSANTLVADGRLYACEAGTVLRMDFDMRCALLRGHYFLTVGVSRLDENGSEIHAIDRRSDAIILAVTGADRHAEGTADLEAEFSPAALQGGCRAL